MDGVNADKNPKAAKNKKATKPSTTESPKKVATGQSAGIPAITNYAEVQNDEIEALKAIYADDFEEIEAKKAWGSTTHRKFRLKIKSAVDDNSHVFLHGTFSATYPKTAPLLTAEDFQGLHERTQKLVRSTIDRLRKELLGQVMIYEIVEAIREIVDDAVEKREAGILPSLNVERTNAQESALFEAEQTQVEEARKQREEQEERERLVQQKVDYEVQRRKEAKSTDEERPSSARAAGPNVIEFDQPAVLQIGRETFSFRKVIVLSRLSRNSGVQTFLAKAEIGDSTGRSLVAVKRVRLRKTREEIVELESLLASTQAVRHSRLISVFAYRIDTVDQSRPEEMEAVLCTEYADRGTLQDLLELGELHPNKARQFAVDMLEALDHLHRNGLVHGYLSMDTVAMVGQPAMSPKLSDFIYSHILYAQAGEDLSWTCPDRDDQNLTVRQKQDVWALGVVVSQMFLGVQIVTQYRSPQQMLNKLGLSASFHDFLSKMFATDAKKRLSAFDLLSAEFLRSDEPALSDDALSREVSGRRGTNLMTPLKRNLRRESSNVLEAWSRYTSDFTEIERLGKGGFGEVVKARNKLEGGLYAVKRIKQGRDSLDKILVEARHLRQLNHPYVVRYYNTWVEDGGSDEDATETETATETITEESDSDVPRMDFGFQSTSGLDFLSANNGPQIEFGNDSDEDDDDDDNADLAVQANTLADQSDIATDEKISLTKWSSKPRRGTSILYIQMEYCEGRTLRHILQQPLKADDAWRYMRQITEGLAHIHSLHIIHRDLKPDNVFFDIAGNPKIGDFGLARADHLIENSVKAAGQSTGDMTRSVGTALYTAPELTAASNKSYGNKVDMYSLGIMFYEMNEFFPTRSERVDALLKTRGKKHFLSSSYETGGEKEAQGKLILSLISHSPTERPSTAELLESRFLPARVEDEAIRQALTGISDSRSPYHRKMISALFSQNSSAWDQVRTLAWEAKAYDFREDPSSMRLRGTAIQTLESIFRRHGAEEARRPTIIPRSGYYANANPVQVLDNHGNLLQLPVDLVLPHARQLGENNSKTRCTYAFGGAYRDPLNGDPPDVSEEIDFDIVDHGNSNEQSLNDVEVIKVMDEIICELPYFATSVTTNLNINHSKILSAILAVCAKTENSNQKPNIPAIKEILSRLGSRDVTWSKIKGSLRAQNMTDTMLNDLQQFEFRDLPERAFARLRTLLADANPVHRTELESGIRALKDAVKLARQFDVQTTIYVSPLASINAKFYEDGIMFQCVSGSKSARTVLAAGGRYDSLIRSHRNKSKPHFKPQGAVGVSIGLGPLVAIMARSSKATSRKAHAKQVEARRVDKRCEVLVAANGSEAVQDVAMKLLTSLWTNGIRAELAFNRTVPDNEYNFVVTVRHEASLTAKVQSTEADAAETDVPMTSIVSHLQHELKERESGKARQPALLRQQSQQDGDRKSNVQVLFAKHGSKKSNKYQIVNDAQEAWSSKLSDARNAPIVAVEGRDEILNLIQTTKLSDAEGWRKLTQSVPLNDRLYVKEIQDLLVQWREKGKEDGSVQEVCLYNFRTQHCVYYDITL